MSLGSIAHLQYYFARTGLLDGKGGRTADDSKKNGGSAGGLCNGMPEKSSLSTITHVGEDSVETIIEEEDESQDWEMMLPPTVSTYSHRVQYLPPPPDVETLRHELTKALLEAEETLQEVQNDRGAGIYQRKDDAESEPYHRSDDNTGEPSPSPPQLQGWHVIQGMRVLDVITLAIRAAKIYYTTHEHPIRLYGIKSERQIREELLSVLDVLKRMASRNFAGGLKDEELRIIECWVHDVQGLAAQECAIERQEVKDRERWQWLEGSWSGQERKREWLFMCSFLPEGKLPEWAPLDDVDPLPTSFLQILRNGLMLVHLHNAILKKSKRQFGEIKAFHTDTAKPYRCAENLRYWIKAAEIRWETKLKVDVTGVVHGKDEAWRGFDAAILQWCKAAREELTQEWKEGSVQGPSSPPSSEYADMSPAE